MSQLDITLNMTKILQPFIVQIFKKKIGGYPFTPVKGEKTNHFQGKTKYNAKKKLTKENALTEANNFPQFCAKHNDIVI